MNMPKAFDVPVLILGFNRPDLTLRVINSLREIGAKKIYFSVDGPRTNNENDYIEVEKVRALSVLIDWECDLHLRFSNENLGLMVAISSGINWFFTAEEEGIILEDDCLPTKDFFEFTERMLSKYRDTPEVMHISGSPYFSKKPNYMFNHFFSTLTSVWGWATWRSSWEKFDLEMRNINSGTNQDRFLQYFGSRIIASWFLRYYLEAKNPKSKVWATQWAYSLIQNNAYAVVPVVALVHYIGSDFRATHGIWKSLAPYDSYPVEKMPFLPDPPNISVSDSLVRNQFDFIRMTDPNLQVGRRLRLVLIRISIRILPSPLRVFLKEKILKNGILN